MFVQRFVLNHFGTNCYVVSEKQSGPAVVIDPCGTARMSDVYKYLEANDLQVKAILMTHGHADHILGVEQLRKDTGAPVFIHELDAEMLTSPDKNLSKWMGEEVVCGPADRLLKDGEEFEVANLRVKVLHTPGHTPGGICMDIAPVGAQLEAPLLVTGDTLFARSIGRTDFPGGSAKQLLESIEQKLLPYPDETRIYPGHQGDSTIGAERIGNPFL